MEFIKTDAKEFNRKLSFSSRLDFLTVHTEDYLNKADLYVATGGGVGFGLTRDKELINLFNNTGTKLCGCEAINYAISKGADKVFCFDGFLRKYYERFGFEVVYAMPWNDDEAPESWDYEKYYQPDVMWLERR